MLKLFRPADGKSLPLSDPWLYALYEDERGYLMVGTRFDGLFVIDPDRKGYIHYFHQQNDPNSLIEGSHLRSIAKDNQGKFWISTINGVSIFDPSKGRFYNGLMESIEKAGITKRWVNGIERDTLGNMWLAMDGEGLLKVEETPRGGYKFHLFNTANGLNDPAMGKMCMDPNGHIWLINYGLLHLNPYDGSIHIFNEYNGLNRGLSIDESLYVDPWGNILIGLDGQFETKNTRELDYSNWDIKLLIETIEVNGKNYMTGTSILRLKADENNLTFRFSAICFQDVEQVLFKYKLEGYDKAWILSGTNREARYTNLPPGEYRFCVSVSNRGRWLNEVNSARIVIRPFFYKTIWFFLLVLVFLGIIITGVFRYRVSQLLKLERLRTRIATDLHDDVGSTLSSISILSDVMIKNIQDPESQRMLSIIGRNSHAMLEKLDDLIWMVNPSNDSFRNLGLRIREYAIPLFESAKIRFDIRFDERLSSLSLPMDVRRNIYLIIKEAVNNLVKYSECKTARIHCDRQHPGIILEISDDGKGFDPDLPTRRNGLKNMKSRAVSLGGSLEILSGPGKGTKIILKVKQGG